MFSALLPSQERKDLLLFLMASDFFGSSGNCKSGGYRTSQYFLHSLSSLSLFFSPARDFFPSFYPLLLLGVSVSLILITILQSTIFIFTSSYFPSAFCSFPGHFIPLSQLFLPIS